MTTEDVRAFHKVCSERRRQEKKFPDQRPTEAHWLAILGEEYGGVCRAICENDDTGRDRELVQVAAVALRWLSQTGEV